MSPEARKLYANYTMTIEQARELYGLPKKTIKEKLEGARSALKGIQAEIDRLEGLSNRFPTEPKIGSVLIFVKESGYGSYTYVAYHAPNNLWYLTGRGKEGGRSWDYVVNLINESYCELVTDVQTVSKVKEYDPNDEFAYGYGRW
jgi:hypothetical protein